MNTKDIVYVALFCALTAALGLFQALYVPGVPVPITAQSMGLMIAGGVIGAWRGGLSQALFVALIIAGQPMLAGGRGGIGLFATASGGFLIGFIVGAIVTGLIVQYFWRRLNYFHAVLACTVGGIGAVYLIGIPYWALVSDLTMTQVAMKCLAFMPGDFLKVLLASAIIVKVRAGHPLIERQRAA